MSQRIFTPEELQALSLSGSERVKKAVDSGDAGEAQRVFDHVIDLYRQFHDLYHGWVPSLIVYLNDTYGHDVAKGFSHIEDVLAHSARVGMNLESIRIMQTEPEKAFAQKLEDGDFFGAYEFYLHVERGCRDLHDFYRDYVSTMLSHVYREYGVDALADCLRASSEKDWMPWMMDEIDTDPRERLIVWADLLGVANFGNITIEEQDDRFVVLQNPCGSCGRQHRGGRYDEPWGLAVVQEKDHPLTYGQGGCSVYRAHIPMMHYIMPVERIGAPWPLVQCPRNKAGQCKVTLYKDPRQKAPDAKAQWSD
jgi:hypothetical protein